MKFPSIRTIGSIALLGGIGYVIYKFYKGDWKLPDLGNLLGVSDTLKETGVTGATGDIIYNIAYPDLRERVTSQVEQDKTIDEYYDVMPPGSPAPTQEQISDRTVARVVAEDITGRGVPAYTVPLLNAVTIGSGLAAIQRNEDYIASLPATVQTDIYQQQTEKRIEKLTTDPATIIAGVLAGPIGLAVAVLPDLIRGATGPTAPAPVVEPTIEPTPELLSTIPEPEPSGFLDIISTWKIPRTPTATPETQVFRAPPTPTPAYTPPPAPRVYTPPPVPPPPCAPAPVVIRTPDPVVVQQFPVGVQAIEKMFRF